MGVLPSHQDKPKTKSTQNNKANTATPKPKNAEARSETGVLDELTYKANVAGKLLEKVYEEGKKKFDKAFENVEKY